MADSGQQEAGAEEEAESGTEQQEESAKEPDSVSEVVLSEAGTDKSQFLLC